MARRTISTLTTDHSGAGSITVSQRSSSDNDTLVGAISSEGGWVVFRITFGALTTSYRSTGSMAVSEINNKLTVVGVISSQGTWVVIRFAFGAFPTGN